jgi:hypothetical protein
MSSVSEVALKRGAATASAAVMPNSITFSMTCRMPMAMYVPPGAPIARKGLSSLNTMEGARDEKRDLPGAREPARPGRGSKTAIAPLYMKPSPSVTTPEGVPSVCVMVAMTPFSSTATTWVVSALSVPFPLKRGT